MFFFFSSRRRHTRWPRDWSSDVCSSDLPSGRSTASKRFSRPRWAAVDSGVKPTRTASGDGRSEERRVGKECRSRWSPRKQKKNKKNSQRLRHSGRKFLIRSVWTVFFFKQKTAYEMAT